MKRAFLAVSMLLVLMVPIVASAGHWVQKEIKWQISSVGSPQSATAIYVRDTLYQALGGTAGGDTTGEFTLNYVQVPPRGMGMPAGIATTSNGALASIDTCYVAWIVIQQDSSVAFTATATAVTMLLDGRAGGFGPATALSNGWVKTDSTFINGAAAGTLTTGDNTVAIPIRSVSPYGNIFRWDELRARISPATGTMAMSRVFLRYYTDTDNENQDR